MNAIVRNGWEIYFHQRLFGEQRRQLRARLKQLKAELSEADYLTHPDVKLLAAVMAGIKEKIVIDPFGDRFVLTGSLRRYGRLKGLGKPKPYRLFFRAFEAEDRRVIIVLWLGFPRKAGDKADEIALRSPQRAFHQARDCYEVFGKMVGNGDFPDSLDELLATTED